MRGRYMPKVGDRVQLWYALRNYMPFHSRCGVVTVVGGFASYGLDEPPLIGGPINVMVQLEEGPAVVVPRGNVRPPKADLQGMLL